MTSLSQAAALAACPEEVVATSAPTVAAEPMPRFERLVRTLILWHHRSRSRAALKSLDDRLLSDIGLDRDTAGRIAAKRFWQD